MSRIQAMFNPKTIALIGATDKEGAVGRSILGNLLRSKERRIFPVNPHASKVWQSSMLKLKEPKNSGRMNR